jgi:hypothetical protein
MKTFAFIVVWLFLLSGCGTSGGDWKLPAEIEGGWKLSVLPPSKETYELVSRLAPKKSLMSGYEGPQGKFTLAAFQLANGPAAFEQVQKWRAQPGKLAFYHGAWFVVLESEGMDAGQLSKIASSIEKTMPD